LARRQLATARRRMQPRLEARFIGIDITDAGDNALIEQDRLEISPSLGERRAPVLRIDIERLRSQPLFCEIGVDIGARWMIPGAPEAANVAEAKFVAAVLERED